MELAPDGSTVHPLLRTPGASMARFELAAGTVAAAVMHRTVEELWHVLSGRGELWLRHEGRDEVIALPSGASSTVSAIDVLGEARDMASAPLSVALHLATDIDVSPTGSSGLAGLLAARDRVSNDDRVAVVFSGIRRETPKPANH